MLPGPTACRSSTTRVPLSTPSTGCQPIVSSELRFESRWRFWSPKAADLGFRSVLSLALTDGDPFGAVTLYSRRPSFFGTESVAAQQAFAQQASIAITVAVEREQLGQARDSRGVVGQAQGIVMERYQVTADEAFAVLRRYSSHLNLRLRLVAERLIADRNLPELDRSVRQAEGQPARGAAIYSTASPVRPMQAGGAVPEVVPRAPRVTPRCRPSADLAESSGAVWAGDDLVEAVAGVLADSSISDAPRQRAVQCSRVRGPMIGAGTAGWVQQPGQGRRRPARAPGSSARSSYGWIAVPVLAEALRGASSSRRTLVLVLLAGHPSGRAAVQR